MTPAEVIDLGHHTVWTVLKIAGPLLLVTLVTGFSISLLQALTQIQEMTLSFIPKILATLGVMLFMLPFFGRVLSGFNQEIFDRIVGLGS